MPPRHLRSGICGRLFLLAVLCLSMMHAQEMLAYASTEADGPHLSLVAEAAYSDDDKKILPQHQSVARPEGGVSLMTFDPAKVAQPRVHPPPPVCRILPRRLAPARSFLQPRITESIDPLPR